MAQTFAEAYRMVRLHASAVPLHLCREFVNEAWKDLARRRPWSFLRAETVLTTAASRSVTVTTTQGSTTVTSAALFLAADESRQFRIGLGPTYTIQTFTDASTIELDRSFSEPDTTATAGILDAYITMPADFGKFRLIADLDNRRRVVFDLAEDVLLRIDPNRMFSGTIQRALAVATPSTYTPTLGRIRYEWWPRPTGVRSFPAIYVKQGTATDETTTFSGVMADGADVLVAGALAMAAEWPGTADLKNPYFNLDLATRKRSEFENGVQRLALRDDEQYPDDYIQVNWAEWTLTDTVAVDTILRASDASIAAYY